MNNLHTYLECEFATPGNTPGVGNPGVDPSGEGLSEPIGVIKGCSGKSDTKKRKKKMRDLKEFLQESLINEVKQVSVNAYQLEDLVKFASSFNPSDKDADWDTWKLEYNVTDKSLIKKICKACAAIITKCDYGTIYITGVSIGDLSSRIVKQEFGAEPDDIYYFLAADGDRGKLFYIKRPDSSADQRVVNEFMSLFIGDGGWEWKEVYII